MSGNWRSYEEENARQREQHYARNRRYHKLHPWVKFVCWARRRCNDKKSERWRWYRENGIKCLLTAAEAKALWIRDGAAKLKRPSLDRINPKGNYTFANCRFIEFEKNARLAWDVDAKKYDKIEKDLEEA